MAAPFKIYTDFECNVKGVKDSYENNTSYTKKYQGHIPNSFAYKVVCVDDKFSKQVVLYNGKMQFIILSLQNIRKAFN